MFISLEDILLFFLLSFVLRMSHYQNGILPCFRHRCDWKYDYTAFVGTETISLRME